MAVEVLSHTHTHITRKLLLMRPRREYVFKNASEFFLFLAPCGFAINCTRWINYLEIAKKAGGGSLGLFINVFLREYKNSNNLQVNYWTRPVSVRPYTIIIYRHFFHVNYFNLNLAQLVEEVISSLYTESLFVIDMVCFDVYTFYLPVFFLYELFLYLPTSYLLA